MKNKTFDRQEYFVIELETDLTLSEASSPRVLWKDPNGVLGEWSGAIDGTKIVYEFTAADMNIVGTWEIQAACIIDSRKVYGEKRQILVESTLDT